MKTSTITSEGNPSLKNGQLESPDNSSDEVSIENMDSISDFFFPKNETEQLKLLLEKIKAPTR